MSGCKWKEPVGLLFHVWARVLFSVLLLCDTTSSLNGLFTRTEETQTHYTPTYLLIIRFLLSLACTATAQHVSNLFWAVDAQHFLIALSHRNQTGNFTNGTTVDGRTDRPASDAHATCCERKSSSMQCNSFPFLSVRLISNNGKSPTRNALVQVLLFVVRKNNNKWSGFCGSIAILQRKSRWLYN